MKKNPIEQISKHIRKIDEIPLFGNAPPLDFEKLSALLSSQFGIEDLSIRLKSQQWKEKIEKKGIVNPVFISPIDSPVYWVMSKSDREALTTFLLFGSPKKKGFSSPLLQEGFYRYLLLETLYAIQTLEPLKQMSLSLPEEEIDLPKEDALCIDLEIGLGESSAWGKLVIPDSFRTGWIQHFSAFPPQYTATSLSQQLPLEIGIKIGSIQLFSKEWKKLKPGDFLLPDVISSNQTGTLIVDQTPLFLCSIHETQIKLLDYAFTTEETMEISENPIENTLAHKLESAEQESKAIKDIPLQISVEIARLKITLDQLMKLSPGNLIDLPPLADKRVSLLTNGQKIGIAELVYLGETLGLKILEI